MPPPVSIATSTAARSSATEPLRVVPTAPPPAGPSSFLDSSAVLVFAHGIVGRADLPIPEAVFAAAAAGVLVVSFLALAALWSRPRLRALAGAAAVPAAGRRSTSCSARSACSCSLVTAYAGLAGTENQRDNLAPWMVYVAFWVGVPCAVAAARRRLAAAEPVARDRARRPAGSRRAAAASRCPAPLEYPARLGRWPAAAGVVGVRHLRAVLGDGARAGAARRADARLRRRDARRDEPLRRRGVDAQRRPVRRLLRHVRRARAARPGATGVLYARPPVVGAGRIDGRVAGTAAVLLAGIGVTAFDGASEGPLFNDAAAAPAGLLRRPRLRAGDGARARLHDRAARRPSRSSVADLDRSRGAGRGGWRTRSRRSSPPTSSRTTSRCSPTTARTSRGSRRTRSATARDLFGGADVGRSTTASSRRRRSGTCRSARSCSATSRRSCSPTTARSSLYGSHRDATRSQIVMLVLMVCFTCLGLWLLSAANG